MKYGLPYKGSKNKLAERIIDLFPRCSTLVDLFCGGCAVTHAAMVHNRFQHYIINDLNPMCPKFFMDVLAGKYNNERRWISREDFFRLKDTDPYVAFVWSFGNNLTSYLYSKEIEPVKRAMHYAIFFSDYGPGKEMGLDLSFLDDIKGKQVENKRYFALKKYLTIPPLLKKSTRIELEGYERARIVEGVNRLFRITPIEISKLLNSVYGGVRIELQHWEAIRVLIQIATLGTLQCASKAFMGGVKSPLIQWITERWRYLKTVLSTVIYLMKEQVTMSVPAYLITKPSMTGRSIRLSHCL
jgi:hypothetical protein